ncbi:phosphatidylinositol-binding protein scs2 [Basidiobolus ranarum]|uniref:Phosphatidylinositol-binding protein scs2 n=1 Tax=Basidiobolus ranarum TaxID=34480 RepID=A0ABR2VMQ3_9FUNG
MPKLDEFGCTIFVFWYRVKKTKAFVSSCSTTPPTTQSYQGGNGQVLHCPQVFEDYESQKSSIDVNNNHSDNMILFHDVMSTYHWEARFLLFVFGIAEANAFSCYKIWGNNAEGILHSDLKCRLAHSLLLKVKYFECHYEVCKIFHPQYGELRR